MAVRPCQVRGQPAWRWGRRGTPYVYGPGRSSADAAAMALQQGRAAAARRLGYDLWLRGGRSDAARGPFRGRVPLMSDRITASYQQMLADRLALSQRLILQYAGRELRQLDRELQPTTDRQDAPADVLRIYSVVRAVRSVMSDSAEGEADGLAWLGGEIDEDVSDASDRQLSRLMNIPLATAAGSDQQVDAWISDNVSLIKSIDAQHLGDIEDLVREAVTVGRPTGTPSRAGGSLLEQIQRRYEVSTSRASLIARDQTAKLTSRINQAQQERYGIDSYEWSTSGDSGVRQEHADLDGRIFRWDSPPVADKAGRTGHPGELWQCRCTAIPVLPDQDRAAVVAQAEQRKERELLILQASPTVQGKITNQSGFSDWNRKRLTALRAGTRSAVGL